MKNWVQTTGFELEMQVASEFRRHDLQVAQGQLLTGGESPGHVELDVMAWRVQPLEEIANLRFFVLAECKKARLPWVLFTSDDVFDATDSIEFRDSPSEWGAEYMRLVSGREDLQSIESLQVPGRPAYGLRTATLPMVKKSSSREKIQPWEKAEEAQVQLRRVIQAWWAQNKEVEDARIHDVMVYFPTIVLDGRLFEAHLSNGEDLQVREVPRGVLELPLAGTPEGIVFVDVVTHAHLSKFAGDIGRALEILAEKAKPEQGELLRTIREARKES